MKHHEAVNQNSLRAYPFSDDSDFRDTRAGAEAMPPDLIVSLRATSASSSEIAVQGQLGYVAVLATTAIVSLVTGEMCLTGEFPVPGKPYPLTAPGVDRVCGHVTFGPGVREGDWRPARAMLLPRSYVYLPQTGFDLRVSGTLSARYIPDARILVESVPLAMYARLSVLEKGYIRSPAIVIEAADAAPPVCSAANAADCKGAILTVNGKPVPEDGNVEIDSADPSSIFGDSVPGDGIPGPLDFDGVSATAYEPPKILVDLPMTVPAKCGIATGKPSEARLPVAVRAGSDSSGVYVQAVFVNDSGFPAIPHFTLSVSADPEAEETTFAPAEWSLRTYPTRGSAAVGPGGWAYGPLPYAFIRGKLTPAAVADPRKFQNLMYIAPPYASGVPGFSENSFSPIGWDDEDTPWGSIPSVVNLRSQQQVDPPEYESLAPLEYVAITYFLETEALGDEELVHVTVAAAAHLVGESGEIVGRSASKASTQFEVGDPLSFPVDAGPSAILESLLPDYA